MMLGRQWLTRAKGAQPLRCLSRYGIEPTAGESLAASWHSGPSFWLTRFELCNLRLLAAPQAQELVGDRQKPRMVAVRTKTFHADALSPAPSLPDAQNNKQGNSNGAQASEIDQGFHGVRPSRSVSSGMSAGLPVGCPARGNYRRTIRARLLEIRYGIEPSWRHGRQQCRSLYRTLSGDAHLAANQLNLVGNAPSRCPRVRFGAHELEHQFVDRAADSGSLHAFDAWNARDDGRQSNDMAQMLFSRASEFGRYDFDVRRCHHTLLLRLRGRQLVVRSQRMVPIRCVNRTTSLLIWWADSPDAWEPSVRIRPLVGWQKKAPPKRTYVA